ncbi:uncharacterized protein [Rutidosis leptorrhynchoides]|uniref:uncharacterized protein n=1 Tax=Rutidosis leptorrhynchoides TaxID=125765 RepID=UPI003A99F41E
MCEITNLRKTTEKNFDGLLRHVAWVEARMDEKDLAIKKLLEENAELKKEIKLLETEFWELKVKGTDIESYTNHFLELSTLCPKMFPTESRKIERYIEGLPEDVQGNVIAAEKVTLDTVILMAQNLMMAKRRRVLASKQVDTKSSDGKIKFEPSQGSNQNIAKKPADSTRTGYIGTKSYYARCERHHPGRCTATCSLCKKVGHPLYEKAYQQMVPSVLKDHSTLKSTKRRKNKTIPIEANMIHSWQAGQRRKAEALEDWKQELITFPSMINTNPSDAPVVIEARIANCIVGRIYTDTRAGADIMYEHCFVQLPKRVKEKLKDTFVPLESFANDPSWSEGSIVLEVVLGKTPFKRTAHIEFLVIKENSQYNVILGQPAMMTFGAVTSTVHEMMKFLIPAGIATLYAERRRKIECVQINRTTIILIVHEDGSVSPNPEFPYQKIIIGDTLAKATKEKLYKILATNLDVFAWQDSDMTGVPCHIVEHKLGVNLNIPPVCQKKRGMAPDRTNFLRDEVKKLVEAGILREVKYQTWVANPVMVRKPDNSWRMCVDFTDINKACPKDNYPLP